MAAAEKVERAGGFTCRVIADHQASFTYALVFFPGDTLSIEDRETVWSGWTWCSNSRQIGAWVPDDFIDRRGDSCVALRAYDSTELTVSTGDILEATEEAGGWLWCADRMGRRGWVPAVCVEPYVRD